MTTCAAAGFMAKSVDATLRAQMRVGARLEVVFKVFGRLCIQVVTTRMGRCI